MARAFAKAFYKSDAWLQCRASFIAERICTDGGLCQKCQKNPGYIVHHRIYLDEKKINNPDISLSFDNLEYLCLSCHSDHHNSERFRQKRKPLRCGFDEKGRPINVNAEISSQGD